MFYRNAKIRDILAVLEIIRANWKRRYGFTEITQLRIDAVNEYAEREFRKGRYSTLDSANKTIIDAMTRRMRPDIQGTENFDTLVENWLRNGSNRLQDILLKHCEDSVQQAVVRNFFRIDSKPTLHEIATIRQRILSGANA